MKLLSKILKDASNSKRIRQKQKLAAIVIFLLRYRSSMRTRNYVRSSALPPTCLSSWSFLFRNGDDMSFVAETGLNRAGFQLLYDEFRKHFDRRWRYGGKGRPPKLDIVGALGLLLEFYAGTMEDKTLAQQFGIPPRTVGVYLAKAEAALEKALAQLELAGVRWPTSEEQIAWGKLVEAKESTVKGRWGFIDGKNYRVQEPTDSDLQNAMYNGWLHAVLITGTFCFGADGCVVWGKTNYVGSWNDGETSRAFQRKLLRADKNVPGHGVLSDSAFPVADELRGKIMTPPKEGDIEKAPVDVRARLQRLFNGITSMRQAAEWGMGAVEKPFRRLLMPLPYNPHIRQRRLMNIYRLYNFRVRTTGISQIRNYFFSEDQLPAAL
jgi:hypothetical protein